MMEKLIVSPKLTVKETINYMEENHIRAVVIAESDKKLIGLFSQGDMRRFFLAGGTLSDSITAAMNYTPVCFSSVAEVSSYMEHNSLPIYPIVDQNNIVLNIISDSLPDENTQINDSLKDVPLVIMAGGKGTRLYPYTKILPKAIVPIGDITISERIIQKFQRYGLKDVYMVLNHKANMVKAYFNDINKNYNIDFVTESKFMGTGGGLFLLKGKVDSTFFLSNCDILIDVDLECIYKTHKMNGNKITFVCAMEDIQIPYGVVETDAEGNIIKMCEKPELSFLTNTGLYVVEKDVIDELEENKFIHLPDIAKRCLEKGDKVGVFPIPEYAWLDMGQFNELQEMQKKLGIQ